jgi:hypothetical protein
MLLLCPRCFKEEWQRGRGRQQEGQRREKADKWKSPRVNIFESIYVSAFHIYLLSFSLSFSLLVLGRLVRMAGRKKGGMEWNGMEWSRLEWWQENIYDMWKICIE